MSADQLQSVVRNIVVIGSPRGSADPTRLEHHNGRLIEAAGWLRVNKQAA
jgi:hypothetical protein